VTARRALISAPYLRVLRKAAEIAGGESALAAVLAVAQETLRSWLAGDVVPPVNFYVAALQIVERATPRP
jgi:DNA-binding transcriptional regulator YdaS (Cro superfamily)